MRLAVAAFALAVAASSAQARQERRGAEGDVQLAGEQVRVRWTDGDTFRIGSGPYRGRSARLAGVNALEPFGPVHRIGASGGAALLAIAKGSAAVAAAAGGRCEVVGSSDRYGRLLVSCPDAAEALVRAGHAMVFAVDAPADGRLLSLQRAAQEARIGMWAGGAPLLVPASLHSADERGLGRRGAYDRIVDTRSGAAPARTHARTYAPCEEVCLGAGSDRACMTYVPYQRRYRSRPACLR
jgi:endonuclease YncB( thermonuclease family)